jgi:hypothetical protein
MYANCLYEKLKCCEYGIAFKPGVGPQIYIHTPHISCMCLALAICMNQMLLMCVLRLYSFYTSFHNRLHVYFKFLVVLLLLHLYKIINPMNEYIYKITVNYPFHYLWQSSIVQCKYFYIDPC